MKHVLSNALPSKMKPPFPTGPSHIHVLLIIVPVMLTITHSLHDADQVRMQILMAEVPFECIYIIIDLTF